VSELEVRFGSIIMNGSSAGKVIERVEHDPQWRCSGWRVINIGLEQFGGMTGMTSFVADYLMSGWRPVPFEWTPVTGGVLEERYVWTADYGRLRRELRHIEAAP
jgi:hypothetical protein